MILKPFERESASLNGWGEIRLQLPSGPWRPLRQVPLLVLRPL